MTTTIEVTKNKNESGMQLLRRFSRKARTMGIVRAIKAKRFAERAPSKLKKKRSALKRIETGKKYAKLRKLGKIS